MAIKLTEAAVAALPIDGRDTITHDTLLPGFGVRVTPSGSKIYVARARCAGRPVRVALGRFPETSASDARKEARAVLDDLRAGKSPMLGKAERAKARAIGAATVADLGEKWIDEHVEPKRKPKSLREYRRLVAKRINPRFGGTLVSALTKSDVMSWHAGMAKTPRDANHALSTLKAMMNFAEDHGLRAAGSNPCRKIERFPERRVQRFMNEEEIGRAFQAITSAETDGKIGPFAAAGLKLALLTGARSSEITSMLWSEVDLKNRRVRRQDSKVGEMTIHLPELAVSILKALPRVGPFVITGARKDKGYGQLGKAWERIRGRAGLEDVRLHDFRHTFASMTIAAGFSLPQLGELLAHREQATTKRYAHLAADMTNAASQDVGAAIAAAMALNRKDANIVSITRGRRPSRRK